LHPIPLLLSAHFAERSETTELQLTPAMMPSRALRHALSALAACRWLLARPSSSSASAFHQMCAGHAHVLPHRSRYLTHHSRQEHASCRLPLQHGVARSVVRLPTALKHTHIHHVSSDQHYVAGRSAQLDPTPFLVGCCSIATCHMVLQVISAGLTGHAPLSQRVPDYFNSRETQYCTLVVAHVLNCRHTTPASPTTRVR